MEIVHGTETQLKHHEKKEVEQLHEPSNDSAEPSNDSAEPSNDSASSQLQHHEKKEVGQIHEPLDDSAEPSDDSAEPSDDSTEPLNDSAEPSGDSSNPSYGSSEQSGDNSKLSSRPSSADLPPSGDSRKSVSDHQPEPEITEPTLSESGYSSTESDKREQPTQTLNQVINENILNTEELSITKMRRLSKDNLNSDKITSATSFDVSKPTLESSIKGSQVDTRSIPSASSDSTKNSTLDPAKSSPPRLYPILPTVEPSTSGQDFMNSGLMDQFDHNTNNSSLRKRPRNPESETESLASESVSRSEPESQSLWTDIKHASFYLTLVLLIAVIYYMLPPSTPSSDDSPLDKFSTYVHEIKLTFPSQDHTFWKTLEASSHRILKKDVSKYPAVILMASSLKHASVALGIARNISSAFDLSVGLSSDSSVINLEDYSNLNAAEQKLQLYNVLDSVLGTAKRRSVVLENLKYLDPLAAVLFYNYCDNDYAPFKDVLIILNLYFDDEKEKIDDPVAVENHLETLWNKGLASDKVKPLLSRVANHIVIVQGERPDVK